MTEAQAASEVSKLRAQAEAFFREAIAASNPARSVTAHLQAHKKAIASSHKIILIAFGKAARQMSEAAIPYIGDKLSGGCIVTGEDDLTPIHGLEVIRGGHPLPDDGSLAGAAAIERCLTEARQGDLVLVLISGGGSSLVCAPSTGISLAEKITLNDLLIKSGADISEINIVRQQFSRLKGGRLAQLAPQVRMLSLILSDVPDDEVSIIASGPTARPSAGALEAIEILKRYDLYEAMGTHLRSQLEGQVAVQAIAGCTSYRHVENIIIGSNALSLQAALSSANEHYDLVIKADDWLSGDVDSAAALLHRLALLAEREEGSVAILAGGETTVKVNGTGKGGRNQEMALRFALHNEQAPIGCNWAFLSGGTDGRDGPTEAAGGLVDGGSITRMRQAQTNPTYALANNDSFHALEASGDLLFTGITGTNVADIQILLLK